MASGAMRLYFSSCCFKEGLLLQWPQGQRNLSSSLCGITEPVLQSHVPAWHLPDLLHGDAEGLDLLPLPWSDQAAQVVEDVVMLALHPCFPCFGGKDMELHLGAQVDVVGGHPQTIVPGSLQGLLSRAAPWPPLQGGTGSWPKPAC